MGQRSNYIAPVYTFLQISLSHTQIFLRACLFPALLILIVFIFTFILLLLCLHFVLRKFSTALVWLATTQLSGYLARSFVDPLGQDAICVCLLKEENNFKLITTGIEMGACLPDKGEGSVFGVEFFKHRKSIVNLVALLCVKRNTCQLNRTKQWQKSFAINMPQ